jgi:hypothetical protein
MACTIALGPQISGPNMMLYEESPLKVLASSLLSKNYGEKEEV